MSKITLTLLFGLLLFSIQNNAQTARVQALHNSPDASLNVVDIYMGALRIIDDIQFRVATPFLDAPAGVPLTFTIAPGNSSSVEDGVFSQTITFTAGQTYILEANGISQTTGYTPPVPLSLNLYWGANETGFLPQYASILVNHGCTDCGNINVSETSVPLGMFINDMPYPQFTAGYQMMPPMDYVVEATRTSDGVNLGSYYVPLATMGMAGQAAIILSSGFANPGANSNGAPFGLFMVKPEGGWFIPLQAVLDVQKNEIVTAKVYPNPARGQLTISIPGQYSKLNAQLFDTTGRMVLGADGHKLDVSALAAGTYILKLNIDGVTSSQKIIIAQ